MPEQNIAVSVKDLEKSFGDHKVLENINLDIYRGETFVIMGGSGSGKSTLLRIMAGGIKPNAGKVFKLGTPTAAFGGCSACPNGVGAPM